MPLPDPQPPPVLPVHLDLLSLQTCRCAHTARIAAHGGMTDRQLADLRIALQALHDSNQAIRPHLPNIPPPD